MTLDDEFVVHDHQDHFNAAVRSSFRCLQEGHGTTVPQCGTTEPPPGPLLQPVWDGDPEPWRCRGRQRKAKVAC